jgi:hypothetical protein
MNKSREDTLLTPEEQAQCELEIAQHLAEVARYGIDEDEIEHFRKSDNDTWDAEYWEVVQVISVPVASRPSTFDNATLAELIATGECQTAEQVMNGVPSNQSGGEMKTNYMSECDYCGDEFHSKRLEQKFCGRSCADKARRKKRRDQIVVTCPYCRAKFTPLQYSGRKYCSDKCLQDYHNLAKKRWSYGYEDKGEFVQDWMGGRLDEGPLKLNLQNKHTTCI